MIPKIIHYCWFGKKELPDSVKECISSWKKFLPDYQIMRWDESNYDINKCNYIKEAYESGKWAFVSDYARLDICYTYGGIYLDTDVEVVKSFDELLLLKGFCGMESDKRGEAEVVNVGLALGMEKNLEIGKKLRDEYHKLHFIKEDGTLDLTTCPIIQTRSLKKYGMKLKNEIQNIEGMTVFPTDYFCPMNQYTGKISMTTNTYSIHHYSASWMNEADQERRLLRTKYSKYGKLISEILSTVIAYKKHYGIIRMIKEILKKFLKKVK